jgi:hypothetical protein
MSVPQSPAWDPSSDPVWIQLGCFFVFVADGLQPAVGMGSLLLRFVSQCGMAFDTDICGGLSATPDTELHFVGIYAAPAIVYVVYGIFCPVLLLIFMAHCIY